MKDESNANDVSILAAVNHILATARFRLSLWPEFGLIGHCGLTCFNLLYIATKV